VHGHQVEFLSDRLCGLSRFIVRNVWTRLQRLPLGLDRERLDDLTDSGVENKGFVRWLKRKQRRIAQKVTARITSWIQHQGQTTICGHTHHASFANHGQPPYFNTGSCIAPGYVTGLEIREGKIMLVKWSSASHGTAHATRELLAPPRTLGSL
jgi:UDP-2,3-diacylglucosamine pyrophosphatase LpxH